MKKRFSLSLIGLMVAVALTLFAAQSHALAPPVPYFPVSIHMLAMTSQPAWVQELPERREPFPRPANDAVACQTDGQLHKWIYRARSNC